VTDRREESGFYTWTGVRSTRPVNTLQNRLPNPLSLLFIAVFVSFLFSCGIRQGVDAGTDGDSAFVKFGTGQNDWEEVPSNGSSVELIYGAQGGYHVWGRAEFSGLMPDVDVGYTAVRTEDNTVLYDQPPRHRWIENGLNRGLVEIRPGVYSNTDPDLLILRIQCANEIVGKQLRILLSIRERASGRTVSILRVVQVVDLENPQSCAPIRDL